MLPYTVDVWSVTHALVIYYCEGNPGTCLPDEGTTADIATL